ncbi:cysteine hydrolase [Lentzea sp. NBRC 102530]|uniref:cysteine hydrolase family protein n=1 Tax=Lentzea sp. NBRC 102530 TaxID=3032201 RepID=UPI0024A52409|nr:cysteine hydrolase [Lentzea sp. NBRC 102530]GLY54137.1 isochorismatase [Lentzea sp. NBRC 102530]
MTTALLVMDFQNGIVGRIPGAEALLGNVSTAVEKVRADGGHVGWARVAFTDDDFAAIPSTSVMARMATSVVRDSMHADAATTQFHEKLAPQPDDIVVRKTRIGAFTTTDLDAQLTDRGVTSLVLAGISTSGVVLSTAREAMDRDYALTVLSDACADPDQATHEFLVNTLYPRYGEVVTVSAL